MTTTWKSAAFVAILAGLATAPGLEAYGGGLSIAPSVVTLSGEAGQSTTQILTFTNTTSEPLSFAMSANDVVAVDGKRHFVEAGQLPASIASTAVFSPATFTVASQQSIDLRVTVTIPPQTSVRAILVKCQGTTRLGAGALRMTASVGTLLTFSLKGDVITGWTSPLAVQLPTASTTFVASQQLANRGTGPVVIAGMLAIIDGKGSLVGKQRVAPWRLLPSEKTNIRVEYGGELPSGQYQALLTYDLADTTLTSSAEFTVR